MEKYYTIPTIIEAIKVTDDNSVEIFQILEDDKAKPEITYSKFSLEEKSVLTIAFNFMASSQRVRAEVGDYIVRIEEGNVAAFTIVAEEDFDNQFVKDLSTLDLPKL